MVLASSKSPAPAPTVLVPPASAEHAARSRKDKSRLDRRSVCVKSSRRSSPYGCPFHPRPTGHPDFSASEIGTTSGPVERRMARSEAPVKTVLLVWVELRIVAKENRFRI